MFAYPGDARTNGPLQWLPPRLVAFTLATVATIDALDVEKVPARSTEASAEATCSSHELRHGNYC